MKNKNFFIRIWKQHLPVVLVTGGLFVSLSNRTFAQTYTWSTIAGSAGVVGTNGGVGNAAHFSTPSGVAVDESGNVYVTDYGNDLIRKLTPNNVASNWSVSTIAGGAYDGDIDYDGTNSQAQFWSPAGIAADSLGDSLYVADQGSFYEGNEDTGTIRKITYLGGGIWQTASIAGFIPSGGGKEGFYTPVGVVLDNAGDIFISQLKGNVVDIMTLQGQDWNYMSIAGGGVNNPGSANGTNSQAGFSGPTGIGADASGNVYVADTGNDTIRELTLQSDSTNWVTTTISGQVGITGNSDGTNQSALFNGPDGIAVDQYGNVFVSDGNNNTVRKMTPEGTNWVVTTIGGQLNRSHGTNDGVGVASSFYHPYGLAVDNSGNVYVADYQNDTIRMGIPSSVTNPPPTLQILNSGKTAYVIWPTSPAGYALQTTTNLKSGAWLPVNNGITTNFIFTGSMTNTNAFFRLQQQ